MKTAIRKMGNSRGVIIPKPVLAQVGLTDEAIMTVVDGALVLRPVTKAPREGWAGDSRRVAEEGDDSPIWPEFGNIGDERMKW